MKMRLGALDTAENEYGHAKHENKIRRPRYRQIMPITKLSN
jgi:hypothetical protein